jgi:acyl carrier protein
VDLIREFVESVAAGLLGFPAGHRLDPLQPLNELGLDSLMALELRNAIAAGVAQSLPATLLFNYPTVDDIATHLSKLLFPVKAEAQVEAAPAGGRSAWDDIQELSDEEVDRMLATKMESGR